MEKIDRKMIRPSCKECGKPLNWDPLRISDHLCIDCYTEEKEKEYEEEPRVEDFTREGSGHD